MIALKSLKHIAAVFVAATLSLNASAESEAAERGRQVYLKCSGHFVYENSSAEVKEYLYRNRAYEGYTFSTKHPTEVKARKVSNMGATYKIMYGNLDRTYRTPVSVMLFKPTAFYTKDLHPVKYNFENERIINNSMTGYRDCGPSY